MANDDRERVIFLWCDPAGYPRAYAGGARADASGIRRYARVQLATHVYRRHLAGQVVPDHFTEGRVDYRSGEALPDKETPTGRRVLAVSLLREVGRSGDMLVS